MAIFNFKTGSDNIDGKIEFSYTRTQNGFTVKYAVFMRRNNSYSGTPSSGTINYIFYISDSYENTYENKGTKSGYTVPNDKSWSEIVSGTKEYILGALATGSFRVGFESSAGSGASSAFNVTKQMLNSVSVSAYATRPQLSDLDIVYNAGNNYYTFVGTIGNNGINNKTTGCKVFYTTDGTIPNSNSANFTITGGEKTSWVHQIYIEPVDGFQTIKARISTLAPLGSTTTPEDNTISQDVAFYSPPYPLTDLLITYNTSRPTPNSIYSFSWQTRDAGNDGINNDVTNYLINIYVNNVLKTTKIISNINTKNMQLSGKELNLKGKDSLSFSAVVQGESDYNNISSTSQSQLLRILSAGVAKIKISDNWKEGQVWIKTKGEWVRSTGVYVKTSNEWKQSL